MFNEKPIGACGLKKIANGKAEYWGYIGEKSLWGLGIGKEIIVAMIQKARNMDLEFLCLRVLKNNVRAYRLYRKMGFIMD